MANPDASASIWRHRASRLALKLNFHHWLARVVPKFVAVLVVLAIFELFRREMGIPIRWTGGLLGIGLAFAAAWAWVQARSHFCNWQQAMVRLETVLGLHNRLSAAQAGVVPWPVPGAKIPDGYIGNWQRIALPLLAGILFLWAAHLVPVSRMKMGSSNEPITEPPEFAQVQNWIDTLKKEDLIQPEKLQEMQNGLDKLRERPQQDWYKQNDLEAANSLKELMEQSMNSLSQDLTQADRAVEAMRQKEAESPGDSAGLQPMMDDLRKSGENMASGNLPLKKELAEALAGGESAKDKTLTPEQLKQLHDRLKSGAGACKTGPKGGGLSDEMQQAMADAASGGHQRKEMGAPGGTGGGKSSAPLELQDRDKKSGPGKMTQVTNNDMSHVALGETLKVTASEHNVNPGDYHGLQNAGAAQVEGNGGEAVWRSTYDPKEADTLSQFFK